MAITTTIILVLFFANINGNNFEHGNLTPSFQDGILMFTIVHQYPMNFESEFKVDNPKTKPKRKIFEKKKTGRLDSRVRLLRKRISAELKM